MSISLSGRLPGPIKQAYADYEKKYDKYVKDMSAYNEAAKKWNAGSRTSAFNMPEPVAPTFGYTDEQVQSAVTRDSQLRQQAVDIAFNPQKYNLSGLGFAPSGPNIAVSRGAPTRGIVTEKSGIASLAPGRIRLPDGTIFDPSQIKIGPIDLTKLKMPFEGMTPQQVQDSLYILGQGNPFQ
tara:strand:- start:1394 stop:1936 length:543 start_codon:yes stop_codon:yes gene_type:complete